MDVMDLDPPPSEDGPPKPESFCNIPLEMTVKILFLLGIVEVERLGATSHYWNGVSRQNGIWLLLFQRLRKERHDRLWLFQSEYLWPPSYPAHRQDARAMHFLYWQSIEALGGLSRALTKMHVAKKFDKLLIWLSEATRTVRTTFPPNQVTMQTPWWPPLHFTMGRTQTVEVPIDHPAPSTAVPGSATSAAAATTTTAQPPVSPARKRGRPAKVIKMKTVTIEDHVLDTRTLGTEYVPQFGSEQSVALSTLLVEAVCHLVAPLTNPIDERSHRSPEDPTTIVLGDDETKTHYVLRMPLKRLFSDPKTIWRSIYRLCWLDEIREQLALASIDNAYMFYASKIPHQMALEIVQARLETPSKLDACRPVIQYPRVITRPAEATVRHFEDRSPGISMRCAMCGIIVSIADSERFTSTTTSDLLPFASQEARYCSSRCLVESLESYDKQCVACSNRHHETGSCTASVPIAQALGVMRTTDDFMTPEFAGRLAATQKAHSRIASSVAGLTNHDADPRLRKPLSGDILSIVDALDLFSSLNMEFWRTLWHGLDSTRLDDKATYSFTLGSCYLDFSVDPHWHRLFQEMQSFTPMRPYYMIGLLPLTRPLNVMKDYALGTILPAVWDGRLSRYQSFQHNIGRNRKPRRNARMGGLYFSEFVPSFSTPDPLDKAEEKAPARPSSTAGQELDPPQSPETVALKRFSGISSGARMAYYYPKSKKSLTTQLDLKDQDHWQDIVPFLPPELDPPAPAPPPPPVAVPLPVPQVQPPPPPQQQPQQPIVPQPPQQPAPPLKALPSLDELNERLKGISWKRDKADDVHSGVGLPFFTLGLGLPIVKALFPQPLISCLLPVIKWRTPHQTDKSGTTHTVESSAIATDDNMINEGDDRRVEYVSPSESWGLPFGSLARCLEYGPTQFTPAQKANLTHLAKFNVHCSTLCARGRPVTLSDRCLNVACGRVLDISMAPISMECYELVRVTYKTKASGPADAETPPATTDDPPLKVRQESVEGHVCDEFCADAYFKAKFERAMHSRMATPKRRVVTKPGGLLIPPLPPAVPSSTDAMELDMPDAAHVTTSPTAADSAEDAPAGGRSPHLTYAPNGTKRRRLTKPGSDLVNTH